MRPVGSQPLTGDRSTNIEPVPVRRPACGSAARVTPGSFLPSPNTSRVRAKTRLPALFKFRGHFLPPSGAAGRYGGIYTYVCNYLNIALKMPLDSSYCMELEGRNTEDGVSATEKARDAIREMIIRGEIAPGAPLRESELAEAVGISRTPVREALRLLTASGLAEIHPNQGASVARLTREDAEQIFVLRVMLESRVAAEAATRITDEAIDALEVLQDRMERPAEFSDERRAEIANLNRQFHRDICMASGESRIASAALSYIDYPVMLGTFRRYSPPSIERGQRHHRELIAAFRSRDSEWAEAVMRCHILAARNAVIGSYETAEKSLASRLGGRKGDR